MKLLITAYFFILYFIKRLNCQQEPLRPKYIESAIIKKGDQVIKEIKPHQLFVFQVESKTPFVYVLFHGIEKKTLLYNYETVDIEELFLEESDVLQYLPKNYIAQFPMVESYSSLGLYFPQGNYLTSKAQGVIVVYCPLNITCSFFMTVPILNDGGEEIEMNLTENDQSFMLSFEMSVEDDLILHLPSLENDMNFYINATMYSGAIVITKISINDTPINPKMTITPTQDVISFTAPSNAKIIISILPISSAFVVFNYRYSEISNEEIAVNLDKSMTYTIDINSKQSFKVNEKDFYKSSLILLNIKADNCYLDLTTNSNDIEIFSKTKDFYQLFLSHKADYTYTFEVFADEKNNKNKKCTFYIYGSNNEHNYQMLMMENVNYRIRLSDQSDPINFQFPYIYSIDFSPTDLILEFYSENKDTYVLISINNMGVKELSFWGYRVMPFPVDTVKALCVGQLTCVITITIQRLKKVESYIDIKVTANRNALQYIPTNTMIGDLLHKDFTRIFYTKVNYNDKGKIKVISKTKGLGFKYKVVNKQNTSRNEIVNGNWIESSNNLIDEGKFSINEECIDECYLVIRLEDLINTDTLMNYLLFIENNDQYIDAINNEVIKGSFDFDKEKYTFRFTLENISKFQIILGGSLVKYQFVNVDKETVDCCETFNETYYPEEERTFVDNVIGDGKTKKTITIEVIAISTNPDPYLSFYEIKVIPFEYSEYPLNYIYDKQMISLSTIKDSNFTYIFLYNDFVHSTYNYVFSFYGKQPKQFGFYYKCTSFLSEEERVNIEKNVDHSSPYYSDLTGIITYDTKEDYFCFMLVETDINTKFNLQISSEENEMILVQNEKRLFVLEKEKSITVKLIDNVNSLRDNYTYLLEIDLVKGEGKMKYLEEEYIQGKKIMYLNSTLLSQKSQLEITSKYTTLLVNLKLSMIKNEDYSQVKMINYTETSNFIFYKNPFPLYFGLKLQNTMSDIILNIRLRNIFSEDKDDYNFTNLIFTAFYTNQDSYTLFNEHKGELKILKQIPTHIQYNHPVINIEEFDSSIISQYSYLIIKVEENQTITDWPFSNIQFDISPYITYNYEQAITLTERRYHYHKMINSYQSYVLNSFYPFICVEFASCSSSQYQMTFSYLSGKEIPESKIEKYNEYGKEIRWIENTEMLPIILNLTSTEKSSNTFIIKYINEQTQLEPHHFFFGNISINYYPIETTIASQWDTTKNNFYKNSTLNAIYYYYLYDFNNQTSSSICSALSPLEFKTITQNYFNFTNTSIPYSKIENIIVAYLSLDDEDFLVAYNPIAVDIISSSTLLFWSILIFVILLLLVLFGTYAVYREIKKNEDKEEEEEELIVNGEKIKNEEQIRIV